MIPPPSGVDPWQYDRLGARWVGGAMHALPDGSDVPWQRVINSQGKISFPPGSPGAQEQRALLEAEGVVFDEQDRVDFNTVGWEGPDLAWLNEHSLLSPKSLRRQQRPDVPTQPSLL
jgi:methylated-DNA-protein-cysteine methyltransferase-like protein